MFYAEAQQFYMGTDKSEVKSDLNVYSSIRCAVFTAVILCKLVKIKNTRWLENFYSARIQK